MAERKRFVSARVDDDTYIALNRRSTHLGMHPSDLIEFYITEGLTRDVEAEESRNPEVHISPFLKVYAELRKQR